MSIPFYFQLLFYDLSLAMRVMVLFMFIWKVKNLV